MCLVCGQTDSSAVLVLCEVEDCRAALHVFCGEHAALPAEVTLDLEGEWYCPKHLHVQHQSTAT